MLRINAILDAVEALTAEQFPTLKHYRNLVRKNFERPSFLVEVARQTMEDATRRTVERTAQVKVTFFEAVDDYHDSQIEVLSDRLTMALALFSVGAIQAGDRFLDLSNVSGEVYNDYAELTFLLSWQDDRDMTEVEGAMMAQFEFDVHAEKEET